MSSTGSILVVADDGDVRQSVRSALAPHVNRIEVLDSTDRLDQLLELMEFDVVLVDTSYLADDRSDAGSLNALARAQAFDPTLSVVLMTAPAHVSLAVGALKQGALDFILKPWSNEKLVEVVSSAALITQGRREVDTMQFKALDPEVIERALALHDGNISSAATALGMSRAALHRRINKL